MSNAQHILDKLLHKIATEQGFQNYELKLKPISTGGANFSSLLYTATITSGTRELNLFIKVAAMKEKVRKQFPMKTYEAEMYVYSELKTAYRVLEEKHQVPENHRLYLPKYYGANATYLDEILVLENLESRGFVTHDRLYSIDWEYAATAVLELVKLHALSIAFQRENSEQFRCFNEEIIADWLNEESMNAFCKTGFATTLTVVREENKGKTKKFLDAMDLAAFKKILEPIRCKVLTHRDFRPSNLMHRRKNVSF